MINLTIVIIRTLIVYFALLIFMRLMGKRQLSELELPEFAVAVLIADLGAHPLQDIGIPLLNGLLPIVVLFCCEVLISGRRPCPRPNCAALSSGDRAFSSARAKSTSGKCSGTALRRTNSQNNCEARTYWISRRSSTPFWKPTGDLNAILYPQFRSATACDLGLTPESNGYRSY